MAGDFDREAIAHAHHKYFCHRYAHECTDVDQFDYDYADELAEIVSLIQQTDDGAAVAAQSMGGSLPPAVPSSPDGPGPAVIGGQPGPVPRRFQLYRHRDVTGRSGVGTVAWGTQWPDGTCALRWVTEHPSSVHWDSVEAILAVHGHSGATEIRWLDAAS